MRFEKSKPASPKADLRKKERSCFVNRREAGLQMLAGASALLVSQTLPGKAFASGLREVTLETTGDSDAPANAALGSAIPRIVTVSLDRQQLVFYRGTNQISQSTISSGKTGHETPLGIFSILGKKRYHESNIYSNASMPFMQRLTWSGIALHASNQVTGRPASHGCVRLRDDFAKELYGATRHGDHVIIAREAVMPRRINHPGLFKPPQRQPGVAFDLSSKSLTGLRDTISTASIAAEEPPAQPQPRTVDDAAPLRIYATRRTRFEMTRDLQETLNALGFRAGVPDGLYGPATVAAIKRYQSSKNWPLNGLPSDGLRKRLYWEANRDMPTNGVLYVRQDQKPLFDVPIVIRDGHLPLGTQLFIAGGSGEGIEWYGIPIKGRVPGKVAADQDMDRELANRLYVPDMASTLDRLVIDAATRERVGRLITPGASFAVSDSGLGTETGKGTDFIVQVY